MEDLSLPVEELGEKGKSGILKNRETRMTFLSDPLRKIRFVYTPKHASWLNQIELWFSVVVRRVLDRGEFKSVELLKQRLLDFVDYFNRTMAKPYKWTKRVVEKMDLRSIESQSHQQLQKHGIPLTFRN